MLILRGHLGPVRALAYSPGGRVLASTGADRIFNGANDDGSNFQEFVGVNRLSRFRFDGNQFVPGSEQTILEVTVDRGQCCHTGGDIGFDDAGNLYLATGDDTNPYQSDNYTPIDERPNRSPAFDAQRSAAMAQKPSSYSNRRASIGSSLDAFIAG